MQNSDEVFKGYSLNPCPISVETKGYCNYVGANRECYYSCDRNAFDTSEQRANCYKNCQTCGVALLGLNGKATSEIPLVRPPFWIEPNFFRQSFVKYKNVEDAYKECTLLCDKSKDKTTCKQNCYIDAMSIYRK